MSDTPLPGMPPQPLPAPTLWAVSITSPDLALEFDAQQRALFDTTGNWVIVEPVGGGFVYVARDSEMVVESYPIGAS